MGGKLMAVWMAMGMVAGIAPLARAEVAPVKRPDGVIEDYMTPEQAKRPDPAAAQVAQNAAVEDLIKWGGTAPPLEFGDGTPSGDGSNGD